jgi:uncharacterized protein (TIGR02145 family)
MKIRSIIIATIVILNASCKKDNTQSPQLKSIAIKTAPLKTTFLVNEILDLSGLVITLTMDNNKTEDLPLSSFASKGITCSPADGTILTKASTEVSIKHTVTGISVSQGITVGQITSLSIKTAPTKTCYYLGEALNLEGIIVTITMDNGSQDITLADFASKGITCSPLNGAILNAESTMITITHTATGINASQNIKATTTSFTDARDGKTYKIVIIGNQIWMAENLNYYTSSGSSYYNNDSATYAKTYGRLYNWATAQNVSPAGWHLPNEAEWTILFNKFGGITVAGGKLKETGTSHWDSPNTGATNESGFGALPGGVCYSSVSYMKMHAEGCFWSSTASTENNEYAFFFILNYDAGKIFTNVYYKYYGFSIRCIRD